MSGCKGRGGGGWLPRNGSKIEQIWSNQHSFHSGTYMFNVAITHQNWTDWAQLRVLTQSV